MTKTVPTAAMMIQMAVTMRAYRTRRQWTHAHSSLSNIDFASVIRSISHANSLKATLTWVGWRVTHVFDWGS